MERATRLREGLKEIGGLTPTPETFDERVTAHGYHLFSMRYDEQVFEGLPRARFVEALQAEGLLVTTGYPHPIYRHELFKQHPHVVHPSPEVEVSHQPTRQRERQMTGFKSAAQAQQFLSVPGVLQNPARADVAAFPSWTALIAVSQSQDVASPLLPCLAGGNLRLMNPDFSPKPPQLRSDDLKLTVPSSSMFASRPQRYLNLAVFKEKF